MAFRFVNGTDQPVQVCIEWFEPSCGVSTNDRWRKRGWYVISPGGTATVHGGDLRYYNRVWYFYAETTDQSWVWTSPSFSECLPWVAFDWCTNTCNTNARYVGLRETIVAEGAAHKTITLRK
jgi:hypothetical protein